MTLIRAAAVCVGVLAGSAAVAGAVDTFKPFKLRTPEGKQVALADVLDRATLVVFFFPTCSYCAAAYPGIERVHDAYGDRGLSLVWINVLPEQKALIEDWRRRHGQRGTVLLGGSSVQRDYRLMQTPTYWLLDARGTPLWRHDGYAPGDDEALEREVARALAPRP
jgi:thiol-disulfide isomerase/thioredoxin